MVRSQNYENHWLIGVQFSENRMIITLLLISQRLETSLDA